MEVLCKLSSGVEIHGDIINKLYRVAEKVDCVLQKIHGRNPKVEGTYFSVCSKWPMQSSVYSFYFIL